MKRLATLIWVLAFAGPNVVLGQTAQKIQRVGFIAMISPPAEITGADPVNPFVRAFVHGLRDQGYVLGRNLALEMRSLEGRPERLEAIVAEYLRLKVDVVFVSSTGLVSRVQKVATEMPIVTLVGPDLIASGQISSHARPAGTVTGPVADVQDDIEGKRLELLLELMPKAKRVAYIGARVEWSRPYVASLRAAAQRLGIELFQVDSGYGDFAPAFAQAREKRADAVIIERSSTAYGRREEIGALAAASGVPSSCSQGELVEHGCLMSYGPDVPHLARLASGYVAKILRGARPGDLPVEATDKFQLMLNLKTARAVRVAIPQAVLLRATRVIE